MFLTSLDFTVAKDTVVSTVFELFASCALKLTDAHSSSYDFTLYLFPITNVAIPFASVTAVELLPAKS